MYCKYCGTAVAEDTAFCTACGKAVNVPSASPSAAVSSQPPTHPVAAMPEMLPATVLPAAASIPSPAAAALVLPGPYAGFWLRLVAYLIDSAILTIAFGAIVTILMVTVGLSFFRGLLPPMPMPGQVPNPMFPAAILGVFLLLLPVVIVATWLYFASMESSRHQGTLGKMALGLFVTDLLGRRISFGRATGRFFAKIITGLIPFFIGYIMAGFTEKKQALHDMIASCLVLKKA
jgi:uncharacterized RDD family membrane protein YckC